MTRLLYVLDAFVRFINNLTALVWQVRDKELIDGKVKESDEKLDQRPLEELTGPAGLPTTRPYSELHIAAPKDHSMPASEPAAVAPGPVPNGVVPEDK